jgi:hypothetical protein
MIISDQHFDPKLRPLREPSELTLRKWVENAVLECTHRGLRDRIEITQMRDTDSSSAYLEASQLSGSSKTP